MQEKILDQKLSNYEKTFFHSKWRPAMAWAYLLICVFDFIIGPVFWTILQEMANVKTFVQWKPMTAAGGGLFHMAMLAIVGVTAWGRTQEKIRMGPFGGIEYEKETFESVPPERTTSINTNVKQPRNVDDEFNFDDIPPSKSKQSRKT